MLAELLGRPTPSELPEAELWLGAHPSGPSLVEVGDDWVPFDALLREDPEYWLGADTLAAHGPRLPFLMKVLAVEQPLSLQTHPDAERAALIFEQERHLPASERRYSDPYAKPELVCAITRFEALCGVRPVDEIRAWLEGAGLSDLIRSSADGGGAVAVRGFLADWLRQPDSQRKGAIARLMHAAQRRAAEDPVSRRILALAAHWPGDPGLIAPVLLHDITLEPGEALFLPAGVLHCYLSGAAIELMAASDNVVRAGLTNKPIHVEELLAVAKFEAFRPPVLAAVAGRDGQWRYDTSCPEFQLTRLARSSDQRSATLACGPSVLLCTSGQAYLENEHGEIGLDEGKAAAVSSSAVVSCRLSSLGTVFRASLSNVPVA